MYPKLPIIIDNTLQKRSAAYDTLLHLSRVGLFNEVAMISDECWQLNAKLIIPRPIAKVLGLIVDCESITVKPPATDIDSSVGELNPNRPDESIETVPGVDTGTGPARVR